jgi:hypothetical protein
MAVGTAGFSDVLAQITLIFNRIGNDIAMLSRAVSIYAWK